MYVMALVVSQRRVGGVAKRNFYKMGSAMDVFKSKGFFLT